ncbi:MAG: GTP 3',8-cyclase MoaA, partial [bacterium]|nr:GTP 3',8-cyclase MoaA [bacterium]
IGVIASVTKPFCGDCTRIRLSLDGKLYTCLFADKGTDLKDLLRQGASDKEIQDQIRKVWNEREDRYSDLRAEMLMKNISKKKIEMFHIGG